MKRRFLGHSKQEPADWRVIHKSKRSVSIDNLQAVIDTVDNQVPNDTHPMSIDAACGKIWMASQRVLIYDNHVELHDLDGHMVI